VIAERDIVQVGARYDRGFEILEPRSEQGLRLGLRSRKCLNALCASQCACIVDSVSLEAIFFQMRRKFQAVTRGEVRIGKSDRDILSDPF
jgi:hypothetical protein